MMTFRGICLIFFIPVLLFFGCSSGKETIVSKTSVLPLHKKDKEKAKLNVIEGSLYDAKGDFASAILEYQEALNNDNDPGIYYLLAKNYNYLGKFSQAVENIRKALASDQNNMDYNEMLADIFFNAFEFDSAIIQYEKLVKLDSTNINAVFNLAGLYKKSKPLTSIKLYRKLLDEIGPRWDILINLIELYGNLDKSSDEMQTIKDLVELDPGNVKLKQLLSEYYLKSGKLSEAITVYEGLLESDPENIEYNKIIADLYSRDNKIDKAVSIFTKLLNKDKNNLEIQSALGFLYVRKKEYKKAEECFNGLLNSDSVRLEFKLDIGTFYYIQSDSDKVLLEYAKNVFKEIVKSSPKDPRAYYNLACIAVKEDNTGLVESNFNKFYELEEKYYTSRRLPFYATEVGRLYLAKEDFQNAIKYLERSRSFFSDDLFLLYYLGFAYSRLGDSEKAISLFDEVLKGNPAKEIKIDIVGQLGLIYDGMKNYQKSDSLYEEGLKLDSSNHLLLNNYSYSLSERGLQLERSERMSKEALEKEPENSSYLDTYGWILYRMGKYEDAEIYLKKAVGLRDAQGENGAVLIDHLGDIYFKLGDKEKANSCWKRSLEMNPNNNDVKEKIKRGGL
jgi:tetratricopeptide (TPR) repeat protein